MLGNRVALRHGRPFGKVRKTDLCPSGATPAGDDPVPRPDRHGGESQTRSKIAPIRLWKTDGSRTPSGPHAISSSQRRLWHFRHSRIRMVLFLLGSNIANAATNSPQQWGHEGSGRAPCNRGSGGSFPFSVMWRLALFRTEPSGARGGWPYPLVGRFHLLF